MDIQHKLDATAVLTLGCMLCVRLRDLKTQALSSGARASGLAGGREERGDHTISLPTSTPLQDNETA